MTVPPATGQPQLSIVVVTHNSSHRLDLCFSALLRATDTFAAELIVVDNASNDWEITSKLISIHFPSAKIIRLDRNRGFAFAVNRGAEQARGEFLCLLNPDVFLENDTLTKLLTTITTTPKAAVVVPKLTFPDGRFQASCRQFPTPSNILFSRGSVLGRLFTQKFYTLPEYKEITPVPAAAGAVMVVRKQLFTSLGGFDERFFMYPEDMDFCLRANQKGYSVLFIPQATAVHGWGQGSKTGLLRRTWYHHYSIWQYFLKHGPQGFALTVLPVLLLLNFVLTILLLPFRDNNGYDDLTHPPS